MSQYNSGTTHAQPQASIEGQKHAQLSLVFGIVGLFLLGIVLGPLAIIQAGKAEKLNTPATAGKVLGWITTIWSVVAIVLFFVVFGGVAAMSM